MPSTTPPVALITGGSGGIGLACAETFAAQGCAVVITGRTPERLDDAAAVLRPHGRPVTAIRGDVGSPDDIVELFARVEREYGRLDVLVVNSGGPEPRVGSPTSTTGPGAVRSTRCCSEPFDSSVAQSRRCRPRNGAASW